MFKKNSKTKQDLDKFTDYGQGLPTLDERKGEYIEFFGMGVAFGRWCLIIAIISVISTVTITIWALTVPKTETKIQAVLADSMGNLTTISSQQTDIREIQKNQLYQKGAVIAWLEDIRTVSSDINVNRKLYQKAKSMTSPDLQGKLLQIIKQHLNSIPDGNTVDITVIEATPYPERKSWILRWKEMLNGEDKPETNTYYSAIINVKYIVPTDPGVIQDNPIGLQITNFNLDQANIRDK